MKNKFTEYTKKAGIEIPFKGRVITLLVDTQDVKKLDLAADKWGIYTDRQGCYFARSDKASGQHMAHKLLFDLPKGCKLEWINGNTLDLRRANLNMIQPDGTRVPMLLPEPEEEQPPEYTRTSDVKGVYFHKASQKWHSTAWHGGKRYSMGYKPDTPEGKSAAEAAVEEFRANH